MGSVLVAFATRNGSTERVAAAIAETLRARGLAVDLAPAAGVRDLVGDRDLVVLGGALYSGRWHGDARRFLKRHRAELATVPVAVFGMGPRRDAEESWARARAQLDRALARRTWLHPVAVTVFGGVDPPRKREHRDLRNWAAISDWGEAVADLAGADPAGGVG